MAIAEGSDFWPIHPTGSQPAKGKDDFVENDEGYSGPADRGGLVGKVGDDDVDQHADTASEGAPEHHGAAADALNEPDWWEGGESKDGVEDTGENAGEEGIVAKVGKNGGGEVYDL